MEPIIVLQSITKRYFVGGEVVHALRDVSFEVGPGEFVAITGPSGSGKSTLMNVLGVLDRPTSGSYLLDGADASKLDDDAMADVRSRKLGFVFQQFHLLPRTSARDNVELPLVYAGVPARQRRRRAEEALARVGLAGRVRHMPNQLSGGQQQRVAIARAIVGAPPLLLADEPTGNLDTRTSHEVMALLGELRDAGTTVVVVTHEPDVAAFAERSIVIRDGRVEDDSRRVG
jgi:putative ABC transport system ATP-binding protein